MTIFLAILLGLVFIAVHVLIGGPHLAFALPAYALLGITALLSLAQFRRQRSGADPYCILSAVALSGYIQFRALLSPYPYFADQEFLLAQAALVVYLLVSLVITKPGDRLVTVCMMAVLAVGNVVVGLHQFAKNPDFTFWGIGRFEYGWRASGFFICPNHVASFFTIILLLAGAMLFWGRIGPTRKVAIVGFCGFVTMGLAITASRGGILGLAVGGLVLGVLSVVAWRAYYMWPWWKTAVLSGIALALLAGGVIYVQRLPIAQKIVNRFHEIPGAMNWRMQAWKLGIEQFKSAPVVGDGAGTFVAYARSHRPIGLQNDLVQAHNDYVELLAEYGLVGGLLFVTCLVLHFRRWWISFRFLAFQRLQGSGGAGSNALALNLGALAAVLAVMCSALFDFNMQIPGVALAAAFAFAILGSPGPVERRTRSRSGEGPETPLMAMDPDRGEAAPARDSEPAWAGWVTDVGRILAALLAIVLIGWAARYWYPEYLTYRGRHILLNGGNIPRGIDFLQRAIHWNPRNHQTGFFLAEAQRQFAESSQDPAVREALFTKSRENFKISLERFPDHDRALWGIGKVYDALGQRQESEAVWRKLLRLDPYQARVRLHYGKHLYAIGDYAGAISEFEVAAHLDSRVPNIPQYINYARIQLAAQKQGRLSTPTNQTGTPTPGSATPAPTPNTQEERQESFGNEEGL